MTYTRTKTLNGHAYQYLVKTFRRGDMIIQQTLKYLGPTTPIYHTRKKDIKEENLARYSTYFLANVVVHFNCS